MPPPARALEPPAVDGKVVTGWNGLAIGALARAGARLGDPALIEAARWAADAVLGDERRSPDGLLVRASLDEIPSRAAATLADYGQLAAGLVALAVGDRRAARTRSAPASSSRRASSAAARIACPAAAIRCSRRRACGAPDAASDGDEPSGLAALAGAATALWLLGAGERYRALAERIVAAHAAAALAQPLAHGALLRVAAALAVPPRQLVVVAADPQDPLAAAARGIPADVVAIVDADAGRGVGGGGLLAVRARRPCAAGLATAYDCRDFACRLPVTDAARAPRSVASDPALHPVVQAPEVVRHRHRRDHRVPERRQQRPRRRGRPTPVAAR